MSRIISEKTIYEGQITDYVIQKVELPEGQIVNRECVRHGAAAAIVAFTADQRMIFVKQYRPAVDQDVLEIPAGLYDEEDETLLASARREFEEETGLIATKWKELRGFYTSPGFTDDYTKLFEARELTEVETPLPLDADEYLTVHALTREEAEAAYERGDILDMKTVWALDYWDRLMMEEADENG